MYGNCMIGMIWNHFTSLLFYIFVIILYLEILLNLQISSVFWWISLCILWNPWISVLNLQYSKLKSILLYHFELFLSPLLLLFPKEQCRIQGRRWVISTVCHTVLDLFQIICSNILQYTDLKSLSFCGFPQYFLRFHCWYCEICGF